MAYPDARKLLITADSGGSNGYRVRLWKVELQKLADESGLEISVSHFPPGTSKWNKIEHRLFSFITQNWRGKPLISHEAIVNLIAATTTQKGFMLSAKLDEKVYPKGIKIYDDAIASIKTEGLMGDQYISIDPGGSGTLLEPNGTITETQAPVDIIGLISKYAFGDVKKQ